MFVLDATLHSITEKLLAPRSRSGMRADYEPTTAPLLIAPRDLTGLWFQLHSRVVTSVSPE